MTTTRPSTPDLPPVPGKRYFTVSEVSALTGLTPEQLRQWEAVGAPFAQPGRVRARRHYQHHEVMLVRRLRSLMLAGRQTPLPGARLGGGSLRAELSSILAWLDI